MPWPASALSALNWNGTSWVRVPVPHPGTLTNTLNGVAAVSASDVWAVGSFQNTRTAKTLIVHWDGTSWARVPSHSLGAGSMYGSVLTGVSATSASDVWAVGYYSEANPSATFQNLILHWDGTSWTRVPSPEPGTQSVLNSVTSVSATDAWAVGFSANPASGIAAAGLVLHWNGTRWTRPAVSSPSSNAALDGVSADSPADAWAVGSHSAKTWALHRNGTSWSTVPSPNPGGSTADDVLLGVNAVSPGNAWAVGSSGSNIKTLIVHWEGTSWARVPSPNPGISTGRRLSGVAAVSASDAWAVGGYENANNSDRTLILHWNGTAWSRS